MAGDAADLAPGEATVRSSPAGVLDVDGRSKWARRHRELIEHHVADLGGANAISEAKRSMVRRAATLTVELERLEARFATDGRVSSADLDLYSRGAGNLRRLLESVGLDRREPRARARTGPESPTPDGRQAGLAASH